MTRLRKRTPLIVSMLVLAAMFWPSEVKADFDLQINVNNGGYVDITSFLSPVSPGVVSGTYDGLTFTATMTSFSTMASYDLNVQGVLTNSTGTGNISGPVSILGTWDNNSPGFSGLMYMYSESGPDGTVSTGINGTTVVGPLSVTTANSPVMGSSSANAGSGYSLSTTIAYSASGLSDDGVGFDSENVVFTTPAPGGLLLALTGLPLLGLRALRKRMFSNREVVKATV